MGLCDIKGEKRRYFILNEESGKPSGKKKYVTRLLLGKACACVGAQSLLKASMASSWSSLRLLPCGKEAELRHSILLDFHVLFPRIQLLCHSDNINSSARPSSKHLFCL